MKRAYITVGALRGPKRVWIAPREVEKSLSGSRNALAAAWQSAHDWPAGRDNDVFWNAALPNAAIIFVGGDALPHPATAMARTIRTQGNMRRARTLASAHS